MLDTLIVVLESITVVLGLFALLPLIDLLMTMSGVTGEEKLNMARSIDEFLYGDGDWR